MLSLGGGTGAVVSSVLTAASKKKEICYSFLLLHQEEILFLPATVGWVLVAGLSPYIIIMLV